MTARTWVDGPTGGTPLNAAALNGMESDIASAVSSAAASATSAANSANLVGAPADTAIATAIQGASTATSAALNAAYATHAQIDAIPDPVAMALIFGGGML